MAFGAEARRSYCVIRFEAAGAALDGEDCHRPIRGFERIVRSEMTIRTEPFHAYRHDVKLLASSLYCSGVPDGVWANAKVVPASPVQSVWGGLAVILMERRVRFFAVTMFQLTVKRYWPECRP